jgi:predicted glycosyltransferase
MKVLLEAHHPAHIHFWKYVVRALQADGHAVLMIGRDRDVMRRLLEVYDWIPAEIPKRRTKNNRFPLFEMLQRQWAVARAIRRFKPDVVASLMGSYTQCAKLLGVRNVIFTDSEFQHFNHRIAHPFADEIHTPDCFYKDLGPKQRRYAGIHELSFLHPSVFELEPAVLARNGLGGERGYIVIRLSAWNTLHDQKQVGIGARIYGFVEQYAADYQILISAEEGRIPPGLEDYVHPIRAEDFHQILAHASFVLSEGASTAAEAACLGIPCVYINSTEQRGYLAMLEERYAIVESFREAEAGLAAAEKRLAGLRGQSGDLRVEIRTRIGHDFPNVSKLIGQMLCPLP